MVLGTGPLVGLSAIASAAQSTTALRCLAFAFNRLHRRLGFTTLAPAVSEEAASAPAPPAAPSPPSPSTSPAHGADPTADLPLHFSLRPSVLSSLFATWDQARQAAARRDHLLALLRANIQLANHIPATSPRALIPLIRKRRDALRRVSALLKQAEREPPLAALASCPGPERAVAYCAALEDAARRADPAAADFASMQRGETSPWAYYAAHFHERYRAVPRLQPLEVIYSKPDPEQLVQQLRAAAAAALPEPEDARRRGGGAGGPHVDLAGVTHAAGKRKASTAALQLVRGSGTITVNGLPFASYFRDAATRAAVLEPLTAAGAEAEYDVEVRVRGGGPAGQAAAVRTALARALCVQRPGLSGRLEGMTRWDGRVVERKKPGREKARRGYTWVKR